MGTVRACSERRMLPENIVLPLSKEWMGGEIWHQMFAARARMLDYTLELEGKIRDCGRRIRTRQFSILALCGAGFHWPRRRAGRLCPVLQNGRHRSARPISKVEANYIGEKKITLERTVSRFACMRRRQGEVFHTRLNWNVQPARDPKFD